MGSTFSLWIVMAMRDWQLFHCHAIWHHPWIPLLPITVWVQEDIALLHRASSWWHYCCLFIQVRTIRHDVEDLKSYPFLWFTWWGWTIQNINNLHNSRKQLLGCRLPLFKINKIIYIYLGHVWIYWYFKNPNFRIHESSKWGRFFYYYFISRCPTFKNLIIFSTQLWGL